MIASKQPYLGYKTITSPDENQARSFSTEYEQEWLTTAEAAAYLRISEPTLHNMTSNGKIRYYKFGSRNRYLRSELKQLLLAQPRGVVNGN